MRHPIKMTRAQRKYLVKTIKFTGDTYNVYFIGENPEYFRFVDGDGNYFNYDKSTGVLTSEKGDTKKIN